MGHWTSKPILSIDKIDIISPEAFTNRRVLWEGPIINLKRLKVFMDDETNLISTIFAGWHTYQNLLVEALAPLSSDQLNLKSAKNERSIEEIATHMIGARARWFKEAMGEGGESFENFGKWDRNGMPVRSATEIVNGLEATWDVMQEAINRWTPADWQKTFPSDPGYPDDTRPWIIWHLIEHDLHHGGEISLTLGSHNLKAPQL
jgi:uncharacterized damage-inducible protein DinB